MDVEKKGRVGRWKRCRDWREGKIEWGGREGKERKENRVLEGCWRRWVEHDEKKIITEERERGNNEGQGKQKMDRGGTEESIPKIL